MQLKPKLLFASSLIICLFFLGILAIHHFQIEYVILGVFHQLLIIPMMLAQLVVLILAIGKLINGEKSMFIPIRL